MPVEPDQSRRKPKTQAVGLVVAQQAAALTDPMYQQWKDEARIRTG